MGNDVWKLNCRMSGVSAYFSNFGIRGLIATRQPLEKGVA